jgi:O-antigen/teichoic acid export membrane protein
MADNTKLPDSGSSEPIKFARNVIWVGLAQLFVSLLGIITLPALTKSYTTEIYGIWSQASATSGLIAPLLTLQFGTAGVRFLAAEQDPSKRRRYLGSMLSAIFIFSAIVLAIAILFSKQLSVYIFDSPDYPKFVVLTFLWTFTSALFSFLISYLRATDRITQLSLIQGILAAIKMLVIVVVTTLGFGLEWIIICMIITDILFILGLMINITQEIGFPGPNFSELGTFLSFSLPQMPGAFLLWIISASDRYFITHYLDLAQTGIYSSSRTIGGFISLFSIPINFVLFPVISKAWEEKHRSNVKIYFEYSTRLFLTLAIPAAAGLAILSQPLLKLLATSEYLVGWELVLMIAIGTIFLGIYQINAYIILLVKQTKWLPIMIVAASITSASLNFILIPRIGIMGAAISNIASYFVLAAIVSIWARKTIRYSIDLKYLAKVILATAVMSLCLFPFKTDGVLDLIISIIIGTAVFIIILFLSRAFSPQDKRIFKQIFTLK